MVDTSKVEALHAALKEIRDVEQALEHCKFGVSNKGIVYKIAAESDYGTLRGGAERSINCVFTIEESAKIFECAQYLLNVRFEALKKQLDIK